MSQLTAKTTVDSVAWSAKRRYKVGMNVSHAGGVWVNTTGKNSEPGVGSDWLSLGLGDDGYGTRIENAAVTGTYNLDHDAGTDWLLTLTGDTTLTETNLPTGTNTTEFVIYLTGEYAFTPPATWTVIGDTYNGAIWNLLAVHVMNGTNGSENITCIISNIE